MSDLPEAGNETAMDDLRSVIAESHAGDNNSPTPEAPKAEAVETEAPAAAGERARGPDGKFVAKADGSELPADTGSQVTTETPATPPVTPEQKPTDTASVAAPEHWAPEHKQTFNTLPDGAKAPFLNMYKQMEGWYTPKLQQLADLQRNYGPVTQIFAPYAEQLRAQNLTPANIIERWASVERGLMTHRTAVDGGQQPDDSGPAMIARLMVNYKINPGDVARLLNGGPQAFTQQQASVPPEIVNQLNQLTQEVQARKQADADARVQTVSTQMETFANEKDANGTLKHPFFTELHNDMAALAQVDISMGKTPSIPDLYDRAVYANPTTRAKLQTFQKDAEDKRAAAERKARAEEARRAGSSVSGSPSGASPAPPTQEGNSSAADDLRATFREMAA